MLRTGQTVTTCSVFGEFGLPGDGLSCVVYRRLSPPRPNPTWPDNFPPPFTGKDVPAEMFCFRYVANASAPIASKALPAAAPRRFVARSIDPTSADLDENVLPKPIVNTTSGTIVWSCGMGTISA